MWTDHASGSLDRRPQLDEVLGQLRSGDTLVLWRLDRLGRSLRHLIDTVTRQPVFLVVHAFPFGLPEQHGPTDRDTDTDLDVQAPLASTAESTTASDVHEAQRSPATSADGAEEP